ncbi:hypothetical protein NIES4070_48590 [Nostoc commune HK-02]|nr:hypothetical protein NIES4070_48590 [Nostoc commune HK-02]
MQEKIRPCFQSPSFNYGVILSTQHSVLSTTEASVTNCKSLVDEVFPTCVYTVGLEAGG